jgi:hypothetical protein
MIKKFKTFDPQLVFAEQIAGSAIALTNEAKLSLYKKSQKSGIPTNVLETVYYRGYSIWNESFGQTPEQFAFDRVNSFIAGGFAADLDDDLLEDAKGYKNPTGGLTQKGRDHYNRQTGGNLKAPVTTPPSKLKAGSKAANRRKSFCARMGGVEGPMKKPNGEPTRKALALRKWNCEETIYEGIQTTGRKDLHGKDSRLHHKELKAAGYVSKGSDANYKNSEGVEHSYYHPKSNTMHAFRAKGGKINHAYEWTPNISYAKAHGADVHEEIIAEKTCNCWDGYKRVPGTKPCAPGSCAKSSAINEKRGLWDNIHAKRERIKNGSGERMRKPGSKGAPTAAALKNSQNEERTTLSIIKNVIREEAASDSDKLSKFRKDLADNKAKIQIDMAEKGEKHPASQQPADFLSRKRHAEKYTPDGIEKPTKAGDGFGSVQQHLRGTLQQQVQSNQGGKFNIQRNK